MGNRHAPVHVAATEGRATRRATHRYARLASVAALLAIAVASPIQAADPATALPGVTVTASRNPGETPAEAAYTTTLSQRLEKNANYPTGREASLSCPSGTSTVWLELARSGRVVGHGVESSSKSQILDQHAVELATRGKYSALPQDAWADGAAKHRFVVSYKFDCNTAKTQKKS